MRRLCIIVLAVLLLYGGVAQALGSCSVDWGRSDHDETSHATHQTNLRGPDASGDLPPASSSVIHCLKLTLQIDPVIETSRIRTTRPSNIGVPLQKVAASGSATVLNSARNYGLNFLALHGPSISIPATSSFRVFLSVFQI